MGYTRKNNRISASRTWRSVDMRALAQFAMARVTVRVFDQKKAVDGRSLTDHKPYSEEPCFVSALTRPTPRGGEPAYNKAGRLTGYMYKGGYAEFKQKTFQTTQVDLQVSGDLRRGIHLSRIENDSASMAMSNTSKIYGLALNEDRPWWGFSDEDRMHIRARFREMLKAALRSRVKK